MLYKAKDVLKEINNASTGELDRIVLNNHHTQRILMMEIFRKELMSLIIII